MTAITRICLRHRRLVVLAWLILTVVGAATASSTVNRLTHTFATPGTAGYHANLHLLQRLGIDGNEQPTIAVLTLPADQSMNTKAGQHIAAKTFDAANQAGHLAIADYANTRDPKLVSADARTTWAVFNMPNPDIPSGTGVKQAIEPALKAAAPGDPRHVGAGPGQASGTQGLHDVQPRMGTVGQPHRSPPVDRGHSQKCPDVFIRGQQLLALERNSGSSAQARSRNAARSPGSSSHADCNTSFSRCQRSGVITASSLARVGGAVGLWPCASRASQ